MISTPGKLGSKSASGQMQIAINGYQIFLIQNLFDRACEISGLVILGVVYAVSTDRMGP